MSLPSGAIWNCRSGFGICLRHTTTFNGTARGLRGGRYLIVSCDSSRQWSTRPGGRLPHRIADASTWPCSHTSPEGIPQDGHAAAAVRQNPRAARGDSRPRRVLVPRELVEPSLLDPFHLGRRAALMSFVGKDPHQATMGTLQSYMDETAFTRWTIRGSDVPPRGTT